MTLLGSGHAAEGGVVEQFHPHLMGRASGQGQVPRPRPPSPSPVHTGPRTHPEFSGLVVVVEDSSDLHLLVAHDRVGQPQVDEEILYHCDFIGVSHTDPCRAGEGGGKDRT